VGVLFEVNVSDKTTDNTRYVPLIHPGHGGTVKVPVSERHNGGKGIEFYRAKGFKTLEEHAKDVELEKLRADAATKKKGQG
jgi:hypothetical protein